MDVLFLPSSAVQYAPEKVQKILVGNKSDDGDKRQVATAQAHKVGTVLPPHPTPGTTSAWGF